MKKKKGFTLIELLAVIIVLAIIALIAMPIIFNVIENAKLKSMENSAYGVIDAVRLHYMENLMNTGNGEVPTTGSVTTLSLSGEHPTDGTWIIVNDANVENGRGIKITGVTFASMQGYVCDSEEDVNGNLTGKVVCYKDNTTFTVADNVINDKGWANADFNVKVTAEGVSNLKYCLDDEECTPNQDVPSNGINITTEGINYLCVKGDNTKVRCNIYKLDKTIPTLTVKTANPTLKEGQSNEIITYLNEPTYGPSNGNVVCKLNNTEITNTSSLAVGTHTVTCNAVSNSGLSSNDAVLTIKVEEKLIRLVVDANSNGVAELGDEVCIGNECFYVLTNDGTNIRMLAKYRIDVSDNTTRKNRLQNTGTLTTVFSSKTIKGTNLNSYEGSIVEDLVGDYKTTLEGLGATISEATLLTESEVKGAPFNCTSTSSGSCNPTYSWLYKDGNTTVAHHWTRSAYSDNTSHVWVVGDAGFVSYLHYNFAYGVRPVVTIATSALN